MIEKFSLLIYLLSIYPLLWLLVSLIPALFFGAFTAFIGYILDIISSKKVRTSSPEIIFSALGFLLILAFVFIGTMVEFLAVTSLLLQILECLIIITLFNRIREKIPLGRKWLALMVTGGIVYLAQSMLSFFYAIASYGPPTLSQETVFLSGFVVFVVYAIPISAATLGIFLFLKRPENEAETPEGSFIRFIVIFCGVLLFTPFLFIGGLAVYFFTFLKDIRRLIIPILASLTGAAILIIAGEWLTSTQDKSWVNTANGVFLLLISITLIALALTFTISAFFKKKQISAILVYGSILTGIVIDLVSFFNTPLISKDLFSFSSLITWFVSAGIAFGIIFITITLDERRTTFQFRNPWGSQKVFLILVILALFTIGLLLLYPININPIPGKASTHAVSSPPFVQREDYSLVKWNDSLWIIGGNIGGNSHGSNDTWFSRDGITWTETTSHAAFKARSHHSSIVFDNKIWVYGGISSVRNQRGTYTITQLNDIWYSLDGKIWEPAAPIAGFSPTEPIYVVANDHQIYLTSGTETWSSGDGVNWGLVKNS